MTGPVTDPHGRTGDDTGPAAGVPLADDATLRRALRGMLEGRRREVAAIAGLVVVSALATFVPPLVVGRVVDVLVAGGGPSDLLGHLAVLAAAVGVGALADRGRVVRVATLGEDLLARLRRDLHATLLAWRSGAVEARSGRLLAVVTGDVGALSGAVRSALPEAVEVVVLLAVAAAVLPSVSLPLAGVLLACLLPVALLGRWFAPRSTRVYAELRRAQATVVDSTAASLAALDTSRALGLVDARDADLAVAQTELLTVEHRAMRLRNTLLPAVSFARGVATAAVLGVGGWLVLDGRAPVGDVVAFTLALRVVFQPVARLSTLLDVVLRSRAALARVVGVISADTERLPVPHHPAPTPTVGHLQLEAAAYAYPGGGKVLHAVDLDVPAGGSLALVGPSGAGKTTLLRLLARLDDPVAGRATLDGVDLRQLDRDALRRQVLLVTQDAVLPGATVEQVVLGGAGHPGDAPDQLAEALSVVGLDLPADMAVADLDEARRQQLVLARVVAADPAVVLLDEATAALDPAAADVVDTALRRALARRTLVVVAHRPATALACDRVVVVRRGRVVDHGAPDVVVGRDPWLTRFAAATVVR